MSFIVKNTTLPSLLDLIAPHSCRGCGILGEPLCHRCKNDIILEHVNTCPNCKSPNPTGQCPKCKLLPSIFVTNSHSHLLNVLIRDYKYNSNRALTKSLAEILNSILPNIYGPVSVVPLPTIKRHIRERGLDHTLLLAKQLVKLRGQHYHLDPIITRSQNTVQVGANRKTRIEQAAKAYDLSSSSIIHPNTTYILFDDVWTTGASIKAAINILKKAGAQKIIIALLTFSDINQK